MREARATGGGLPVGRERKAGFGSGWPVRVMARMRVMGRHHPDIVVPVREGACWCVVGMIFACLSEMHGWGAEIGCLAPVSGERMGSPASILASGAERARPIAGIRNLLLQAHGEGAVAAVVVVGEASMASGALSDCRRRSP
ncbi:hypothetical protein [Paralimibaculum aggregatum]|nr:hypothetical protein [Limibaculum sp. NKW23]